MKSRRFLALSCLPITGALVLSLPRVALSQGAPDRLSEALCAARPLSALHFQPVTTYHLPGKGRGEPESEGKAWGSRVFSVTANGRELEWTILETGKERESECRITGYRLDRSRNVVRLAFTTIPGRDYRVETSGEPGCDGWVLVPASEVKALGSHTEIDCPMEAGDSRRFWRVLEGR